MQSDAWSKSVPMPKSIGTNRKGKAMIKCKNFEEFKEAVEQHWLDPEAEKVAEFDIKNEFGNFHVEARFCHFIGYYSIVYKNGKRVYLTEEGHTEWNPKFAFNEIKNIIEGEYIELEEYSED